MDGSGLGLATSWSIISRHNGFITIDSKKDVGTTVNIFIPLSGKVMLETDSVESSFQIKKSGKILIMDDEKYILDMAKELLGSMGFEVIAAKEGNDALSQVKSLKEKNESFDFVILDLTIPGKIGGKETLGLIKEIEPQIKAIASSGYADNPVMSQPTEYGFAASLSKPYRKKDVIEVLTLLSNKSKKH